MNPRGDDGRLRAEERGSAGTSPAHTFISDVQPPGREQMNSCCLSCSVCGALLRLPEQANTPTHAHALSHS